MAKGKTSETIEIDEAPAKADTITVRFHNRNILKGGEMILQGVMTFPKNAQILKEVAGEYTILKG